jgi:hypothetical protein
VARLLPRLAYHSRYRLRDGQMVFVIRCRQCRRTFCDRYGTAFYDLKTPEEKVQRANQQGLEGLCPEAVARIEGVHPTIVGRWVDRSCSQAKAVDQEVITGVSTENVELDELYSFAGEKHPDEQESDLEEIGQHWTHVAMARESRLMLEVVIGPRTQESAAKLVEAQPNA